jgi:hypothetical protein
MEDKLVEILNSLHQAVSKTSDFALDQLPDVVNSYLLYARVWESFSLATLIFSFTTGFYLLVKKVITNDKWVQKDYHAISLVWPSERVAIFVVGSTTLSVLLLVILATVRDFFLVWLAPKVYLLMAISNLIK